MMNKKNELTRLRDLPALALELLLHPINALRTPRLLSWPSVFSLQAGAAMASAALVAAAEKNFFDFVIGIFIFPLITMMVCATLTLFLYYFFKTIASTLLDIRRLYSIVVLSVIPYFVLHAFSGFLAPLDLIGFALVIVLLSVGLVEQFGLSRRSVFTVTLALGAAFFVTWSVVQFSTIA
jgi:hypothetical protein